MKAIDKKRISEEHLSKTTNTIILDYLLWLSAKTILDEVVPTDKSTDETYKSPPVRGRRLIGLVDGLILTFDATDRPRFTYDLLTRRIHLTALVILFVYRDSSSQYIGRRSLDTFVRAAPAHTPLFLKSRNISSVVPKEYRGRFDAIHIAPHIRDKARSLCITAQNATIGLIDSLHHFFAVSAADFNHRERTPSPVWTRIALQFSLMAVLEEYLVHGHQRMQAIDACFSYGIAKEPRYQSEEMNHLFRDVGQDFATSWEEARSDVLADLMPPRDTSLDVHFLALLQDLHAANFRDSVTTYLSAILGAMPQPDLCKYPAALESSVLRAPGMIQIPHDVGEEQRTAKRVKMAT